MRRLNLLMLLLLLVTAGEALAFWGRETVPPPAGLDLAEGFDVNTLVTVEATVVAPPVRMEPQEHTLLRLNALQGELKAFLGPWWYWEGHAIPLAVGQAVVVTGSRAQGRDGSFYLFVQQLEDRRSGDSVTLRTPAGVPLWSRQPGDRPGGMPMQRGGPGGGGSRGGGMRGGHR